MDNTFTKGQIVRFKRYKRRPDEKEAYFVVIQEATPKQEMVLYTLNTNRLFDAASDKSEGGSQGGRARSPFDERSREMDSDADCFL